MSPIKQIRKRNGQVVLFDQNKIAEAIWKAAESVGGKDHQLAIKIASHVSTVLEVFYKDKEEIPSVEQIQDLVEKILIEEGHAKTAKAYILYRQKHNQIREQKATILGQEKDTKFSYNALKILQRRYLKKDGKGNVIESPEQLFRRVAYNIAEADLKYKDTDAKETENKFYEMMVNLEFLPNSPTLMNAGTDVQQLAACFVLPIDSKVEDIFETLKKASIIHQTGGGTGYNFSKIPAKTDIVTSETESSSGPVAFMKVFDAATSAIRHGGRRRGANMAILNVDHPDILEFINSKEREDQLTNFNISVGITDKFMKAVENDQMYDLIDPKTKKAVNSLHAKSVLDLIATKAWSTGEPGLIFLDQINKANPTPKSGILEATNPCGEQPLLAYEACNLGSINLSKLCADKQFNWEKFASLIETAVHFLDNAIDMSDYKLPEIKEIVLKNRKIGLGVMGFADLLYQMEIPYDSQDAEIFADEIMKFMHDEAEKASMKIAENRGEFPNFKSSIFAKDGGKARRNATLTTIAPTGTISMIAETSSSIEPVYALAYSKSVFEGEELVYMNKYFSDKITDLNINTPELMRTIAQEGSLRKLQGIPDSIRRVFVVSSDIHPTWHVRIQAAFQKHTDNAVSKTINFPNHATNDDVKNAFLLAYQMECKGITVYRDRSRKKQVLTYMGKNGIQNADPEDKIIDNQVSLPFNNDTDDETSAQQKNAQEVIPPPIISAV